MTGINGRPFFVDVTVQSLKGASCETHAQARSFKEIDEEAAVIWIGVVDHSICVPNM